MHIEREREREGNGGKYEGEGSGERLEWGVMGGKLNRRNKRKEEGLEGNMGKEERTREGQSGRKEIEEGREATAQQHSSTAR